MFARYQWLVALIVLVTMLSFAIIYHSFGQTTTPPILYEGLQLDPILLALDKKALEEAYHDQLLKLFGVWLSSGSIEDAKNFRNGLRNARRGYALARDAITAREKQIIDLDHQQGGKP